METIQKKKEIVNFFLKNKILLSEKILELLKDKENINEIYNKVLSGGSLSQLLVLDSESSLSFSEKHYIKHKKDLKVEITPTKDAEKSRQGPPLPEIQSSSVKIISNFVDEHKKKDINDFVAFFNSRYSQIEKFLQGRSELKNITSINRILHKKEKETLSFIGIVLNKQTTKNNNIILTLEDPSGTIKVLVNKNRPDLLEIAKDIVNDEVIGVVGVNGDGIFFSTKLLLPNVPATREFRKAPDESYAIFLSDVHVGSNNFLEDKFKKFLKWIRGEMGNEKQKGIAKKIKYLFIVGDLVDGVGIYPGQDSELDIPDIYEQYKAAAELLKEVPSHITIVICPGNHDALRISEPQPVLDKEIAAPLYEMKNVTIVSNPCYVNIHSSDDFPGFDILMYHGYSFDYYAANVDSIRTGGGYDRADLIMKFLLQRRHLAPTHTSTLYVPGPMDNLVINKIPDFFVTGHIHKVAVATFRNITMICGSCWQSKTSFQEKVGHNPEPAKVPIVNLQTRAVKLLRF